MIYCCFVIWRVSLCVFQNIELKVEVESLKQELTEKQEILNKALWVNYHVIAQTDTSSVQ